MTIDVRLRLVEDKDLPIFFEQQRDPDAVRMAAFTHKDPEDRNAFNAHWTRIRGDPRITNRTILAGGRVVGNVAAFVDDLFGKLEVTYWIGKEFWGQGIATRALSRFLVEVTKRPIYGRAATDNEDVREVNEVDLVCEEDPQGDPDPDAEDGDQRDLEQEHGEDHPTGEADRSKRTNLRATLDDRSEGDHREPRDPDKESDAEVRLHQREDLLRGVEGSADLFADIDRLQSVREEDAFEIGPESADVGGRVHLEEVCGIPLLGREDGSYDILVHEDAGRELERLFQDADNRQVHDTSCGIERANGVPRDDPEAAPARHELVRPGGAAVHDREGVVVPE